MIEIKKTYEVRAVFNKTGRRRSLFVDAPNEEIAIENLKKEGYIEPFEIRAYIKPPPPPPTANQLEYARDLKISIPNNANLWDVSAMISKKTGKDSDPNPDLVEFAKEIGLTFSDYIGKRALYNLIYANLTNNDKIAFFVFCVYRWISDDRRGNLNKHPYRQQFYWFANGQIENTKFLKSLENYNKGEDIRFFGKIIYPDGDEHYGGSTNTLAYKTCVAFLNERFGLQNRSVKKMPKISQQTKQSATNGEALKGCGCLTLIVILITSALFGILSLSPPKDESTVIPQNNNTSVNSSTTERIEGSAGYFTWAEKYYVN